MVSIKEVAERFHLPAHTIRYYEKEGLLHIPRDQHGIRQFDDTSLSALTAITYYRHLGLSIRQIRELLREFHNHDKSLKILSESLQDLTLKITELEQTKIYIEEKIELHHLLSQLQKAGKSEQEQYQAYQQFIAEKTK